jgi:hypothetical protein
VSTAGPAGIEHEHIAKKVFDALDLPLSDYSLNPNLNRWAADSVKRALTEILGYRLYLDQRRGWRITSPNLEQTGLLVIRYRNLEGVCADNELWQDVSPVLIQLEAAQRRIACETLLDLLRRELAIEVNYLDADHQQSIKQLSSQHLKEPWAIDENEKLITSAARAGTFCDAARDADAMLLAVH